MFPLLCFSFRWLANLKMCAPHPRRDRCPQAGLPSGVSAKRGTFLFMSGRQWPLLLSPVDGELLSCSLPQHSGSHLQSSQQKGSLILSPACPFLGPSREALTCTHSITAYTSNSQIRALNTHRIRNAALLRCIATNKPGFASKNEAKQPSTVQQIQGYAVHSPPPPPTP